MNTEPVTVDLNDFPDLQNASPQTEQLDPADMAQVGDSPAMQEVTLDPKEAEQLATRARHAEMVLAGVQPFQSDTPTDDELAYAKYLRDEGHLKNPDGPGFWHAVGDMISSTAAGVPEVFIEAGRKTAARFGTEQEQKEALAREEAFSAEMVNKTKAMYEALAAGSQRLVGKAAKSIVSTLPEYDADPAFRARVQKDDDLSWYRLMRKMTVLSKEQQMVHDEAADIAIKNGWSASGLENATNAGTFAADPGQLVLGAAMGVAGKGIGAAARAVGLGEQTAALGVADAMRAEVMANAARISTLEKAVARTSQINTKDGAAMYQFWNAELGKLSQTQAVKEAALKALDESNAAILKNAGRPSILGRAAGTAVEKTGSGVEAFGNFLSEMNQGVVDRVLNAVDANAPKWLVHAAEKAAPTAVAGGVAGAAMSDDTMYGFLEGAAAGALAPGAISNAGRLARILGENYLIGRTTIPYFARMATDAEANGLERWAFRQMDKFSPAVEFSRNLAVASGKGAAVGAGLGYVAAGGEDTDITEAAASGVAGHFTPWGFISSVHGFWSPVRTPAEYQGMQAANIRALRERWAGSDNLARFDKLNPSQQASVSSVLAANPDVILRLIGTDDAVIKADQLARGQIPQEGLANVPGFHYSDPVTGRSVITLNPQHPDAMRPVLAHEFWHKAQAEGIAQSIVTELLGDAELGLPGLYTEKAPDGTLRTTAEFAKAKAEYEARLKKSGVTQTLTDAEFAMEHASEQGADFVMSGKFDEALRPTVGSLMLNLMPEAVRNAVGSTGAALNADGSIRGTMNLGLKPSPAVEKLLNAYMKDWRVGRNREAAAGAKNVEITREQILANPQVLEMFRSSSSLNVDPATGQIAGTQINPTTGRLEITDPKKVFKTTAQMAKEQAELTQVVMEAVKNAKDTVSDRDAVKVTTEKGREVAMGRYLSDETLASIEKSGRFNAFQLEHIKNLNALTKAGTGNHVRFFYQPADVRGRYGSLAGHWREEVPYSWHISKQDNVLFRTVSHDKVVKNLDKLWEKHNDRATALWSSQVSMFADARTYLGNLSAGREGKAGLSEGKRDFLNLALGINTTDRAEVNPLYDEAAHRRLDSFITARRIDRTNRITLPERSDKLPWSYDAYGRGRVNATAGEKIERVVGENAEFAKPPTDEQAINALSADKKQYFGKARSLPDGTPVGLRIDIPAYERKGTYVVTVHESATESNVGDRIGYDTVVRVSDPKFFVKEGDDTSKLGAKAIKQGRAKKHPIATVEGSFNSSREIPADINEWTPAGFDPKDHSYFYDKRTDEPIVGGKEAISIGNTVFVKDPVYGNKGDFEFTPGSAEPRKVEEVAKELGLSELGDGAKKFGYFMHEMNAKGVTPRDVLKAYLITTSSINRRAVPTEKIAKNWEGLVHDEVDLRPEDAFSKLLGTAEGQRFLDAAVSGKFDEDAANAMLEKFKPFGLYNTQREYMRNAAENLSKVSEAIIDAVKTMPADQYADFIRENFKGISYGKVGFMSGMLGRGDFPTVDVRERKLWYGDREVKVDKKILTQVRDRLADLGIELHDDLKQFYQTVVHHAVWDKLEGTDTSHADIKQAMLQFTPGSGQPESPVAGYTPTKDVKNVPEITLADLKGKKLFPILADLTAVGRYKGIDSAAVVPVDLFGGPNFPLMQPNKDAGVVWANEGKGVGTRKLNLLQQTDGYAVVTAMTQNTHESNSSTVRAFINTVDAYVKDGRISAQGIKKADRAIKGLGVTLPSVADESFGTAVRELSFDARKAVVGQLERAEFEEYGFPPAKRVLDAVRDPEFHGVDYGDGLLVLKLDAQDTLVQLGENGTPTHPDYTYGVRGQIVGKLKRPIPSKLLFSEFYEKRRADETPESADPRAFSLKMPVTEVTEEKVAAASRLESLTAQNAQQMRAALASAAGAWATSDNPVNKGGVGIAGFVRALRENKSAPSLTPYTEETVKAKVKAGEMKVFKLDNAEIYFALAKDGDKQVISLVVNNEPGAKGVAAPAVLAKAIQEGATHLDCFAVASEKYPQGFLPELYSLFGFENDTAHPLGPRVDFSREYFDADWKAVGENPDIKFADLLHLWQSEGWNPNSPKPQVAFMRLRNEFTDNASRQDYHRRLLEPNPGLLADGERTSRGSASADAQPNPASAGAGGAGGNNPGADRGVAGARGGVSGSLQRSIDTYRSIVRELASLSDEDARLRGLDVGQLRRVREALEPKEQKPRVRVIRDEEGTITGFESY